MNGTTTTGSDGAFPIGNCRAFVATGASRTRQPPFDARRRHGRFPAIYDLAVGDHVHTVAERLAATSEMLKHAVAAGRLTVVEAYYSLDTGEVTRLR